MLAHLIQRKGKGGLVFVIPFLIGFILFVIFSVLDWDDKYVREISLLLSSVVLFQIDNKRETIREGVFQKQEGHRKGINLFMWIEMRYWAIGLGVLGLVLLINDIK